MKSSMSSMVTATGLVVCTLLVALLLAPRSAAAQDACKSEASRINSADTANAPNNRTDRLCTFIRNQIGIETDYAAFYRRCGNGVDAEMQAHDYEKHVVALRATYESNCAGSNCDGAPNIATCEAERYRRKHGW